MNISREIILDLVGVIEESINSREGKVSDKKSKELVNHPIHYGGEDNIYEAIKVIDAWDLDFYLGNVLKYINRAGKKDSNKDIQDLKKALWYLNRKIEKLEACSDA